MHKFYDLNHWIGTLPYVHPLKQVDALFYLLFMFREPNVQEEQEGFVVVTAHSIHVISARVLPAFLSRRSRANGIINLHIVQAPVPRAPTHFQVSLDLVASTHGYWRI